MAIRTTQSMATTWTRTTTSSSSRLSLSESTITLKITIMTVTRMISIWMDTILVRQAENLNCFILIPYAAFILDNLNDSVDDMDVDVSHNKSIKSGIDRMLELGRELLQMSLRLEKKYQNVNDEIVAQNRKMMEVKVDL